MGLARIAIAVFAIALAVGLLIVGGAALWGALTNKDSSNPTGSSPPASTAASSKGRGKQSKPPANEAGNTIELHCLAIQCSVFVAGPGPTDVQFRGNLGQNERRIFNDTRLIVSVDDASTVSVTINGHPQPMGKRGESKTYEVPSAQ